MFWDIHGLRSQNLITTTCNNSSFLTSESCTTDQSCLTEEEGDDQPSHYEGSDPGDIILRLLHLAGHTSPYQVHQWAAPHSEVSGALQLQGQNGTCSFSWLVVFLCLSSSFWLCSFLWSISVECLCQYIFMYENRDEYQQWSSRCLHVEIKFWESTKYCIFLFVLEHQDYNLY